MKSHGCVSSFIQQRDQALLNVYRRLIDRAHHISLNEISQKIVNEPAPRFWVSVDRATIVISEMLRGKPILDNMRPSRREMFSEIFRRVIILRKRFPKRYLYQIVNQVVHSPAPKFYIMPSSAIIILCKIRNNRRHGQNN